MTCKECLYYEICQNKFMFQYHLYGMPITYMENVEERCNNFKPKSRFVEFPCEVGQKVWFVRNKEILEATVVRIELNYYTNPQVWLSVEYFTPIFGKNEYKSRVDLILGKTVFLSKEEAEKALAERSK